LDAVPGGDRPQRREHGLAEVNLGGTDGRGGCSASHRSAVVALRTADLVDVLLPLNALYFASSSLYLSQVINVGIWTISRPWITTICPGPPKC
jgi:hypothetical protein